MPTGQVITNNALTALGLLEQGGTPSVSDSVDALSELNSMWDGWGIDEGLIDAITSFQGALVANKGVYTIGASGEFNTARPGRIYRAFVVSGTSFSATTTSTSATIAVANTSGLYVGQTVVGTGIAQGAVILSITPNTSIVISQVTTASGSVTLVAGGSNRNELAIVEAMKYYEHNDLGALAQTPEELYPDYGPDSTGTGLAKLYLWPLPLVISAQLLELSVGVAFAAWALATNYNIPHGYQDAIQYALAYRLLPRFGAAVDQQVAAKIEALGMKAESRIRAMNAKNRQLPPEMVGLQPAEAKA